VSGSSLGSLSIGRIIVCFSFVRQSYTMFDIWNRRTRSGSTNATYLGREVSGKISADHESVATAGGGFNSAFTCDHNARELCLFYVMVSVQYDLKHDSNTVR